MPIQIIWAGKPYPEDHGAIHIFNDIYYKTKYHANCAVLTGYEMGLSALLKKGSDLWLNTPKMYREASGTSGMTAAMNASVNLSIPDGWIPEFSRHSENCFIIQPADTTQSDEQDDMENDRLMTLLEKDVIPMYYQKPKSWLKIVKQSMKDVVPFFDSNRMAHEYYEKMYESAEPVNGKTKKSTTAAI
jgi:starch phosphorylase